MNDNDMTDIHQHVLWGLDDGPRRQKGTYAMLEQAVNDGIKLVAATTHAYPESQPFDMELYQARLAEAQEYIRWQDWPLRLISGCELRYCDHAIDMLLDGRLPTLGDSRYVLIEFASDVTRENICAATEALYRANYLPIIAHVERYQSLTHSPRDAVKLREDYGLIYQINCNTLLRPHGFRARHFVYKLFEQKAVDLLATDSHDTVRRPVQMREAYQAALKRCDASYARSLVTFGWRIVGGEPKEEA